MTTASASTSTRYTPAEVARLSDQDGKLYELAAGNLVEKPAMSTLSNWIAGQLMFLLKSCYPPDKAYVIHEQPTYCFEAGEMRRPDVLLVWAHRLAPGLTHDELFTVPDFAAEVVSPTNTWSGIRDRVEDFLSAGVPLVWVVEPDTRSVHAYRKDGSIALYRANDIVKSEPALPGLTLRVADLFPPVAQLAPSAP
jgi:Uma2 family endonuclease